MFVSPEADHAIPASERTTTPYMTKYERARVLGTRALQIRSVVHLYGVRIDRYYFNNLY